MKNLVSLPVSVTCQHLSAFGIYVSASPAEPKNPVDKSPKLLKNVDNADTCRQVLTRHIEHLSAHFALIFQRFLSNADRTTGKSHISHICARAYAYVRANYVGNTCQHCQRVSKAQGRAQ